MIKSMRKEFIGRLVISYKIGEIIYAYDEITHGLYKFSIHDKKVDMVISPMDICHNSTNRIMGISKRGNELILIPLLLGTEWVFYNIQEGKIRYVSPFKRKVLISGTITIGTKLFLIPSNIYNPIIIFSLDDMKIMKIYDKWNDRSKKDNGIDVWGASSYDNLVVFPIINSKTICCMSIDNVKMIKLNISELIFSVSIYKNKIWILPMSGKYIFVSNLKGEITDKIDLSQIGLNVSANRFNRIVAAEETIFLLPKYEENICVYQCSNRQIIQIKLGDIYSHGRVFKDEITPYWDYILENKILHILPRDCRYKRINIVSLENEEIYLSYGNSMNSVKYWGMLEYDQREYIYEKRKSDLEDFLLYTIYSHKKCLIKEREIISKETWEKVIKE